MHLFRCPEMPPEALPWGVKVALGKTGALALWNDLWDRGVALGFQTGLIVGSLTASVVILLILVLRTRYVRNAAVVLLLLPAIAHAQALPNGRMEMELNEPTYEGVPATAPIPNENRIQNEGGSDGAGLCVIASLIQNGQAQGVPMCEGGKSSPLWKYVKARPGGYSPGKLAPALEELDPNEPYASYVGADLNVLRQVLALGYPVGVTYSWGEPYGNRRIHHMVSGENDNGHFGMIADNNRVEPPFVDQPKHTALTQAELERRVFDGDTYWLFVWTRKTVAAAGDKPLIAAALTLFWGGLVAMVNTLSHAKAAADVARWVHQGYRVVRPSEGGA